MPHKACCTARMHCHVEAGGGDTFQHCPKSADMLGVRKDRGSDVVRKRQQEAWLEVLT